MVTVPHVSAPVAAPVALVALFAGSSNVRLAGTCRLGAVISTTVMIWVDCAMLPHESVAFQVRVMILAPPHTFVTESAELMVTLPQVSLPVALPVALGWVEPVHSTMTSGTSLIVGGVVSTMVMVCVDWAVLPQASVAFQVRMNEPVLPHRSDCAPSL